MKPVERIFQLVLRHSALFGQHQRGCSFAQVVCVTTTIKPGVYVPPPLPLKLKLLSAVISFRVLPFYLHTDVGDDYGIVQR